MKKLLERVKVLVQEHLPGGWTRWEVSTATREEVFGEKLEPNVLNKLIFALPTVGLVWAFIPEADHLTEKGYRVQTEALILGPAAVANRIRASAVRTELVKESVKAIQHFYIHELKRTGYWRAIFLRNKELVVGGGVS
ncbi:unnamed protein product, partial [Iphiclides podalirius]